jgi:hypothetical protein
MKKILFAGCSYVHGIGLELKQHDPQNFCNVFTNEYFQENYTVTNIGVGGSSNLSIYLSASLAMIQQKFDYVFVCWTSYPRYNFRLGFETYEFGKPVSIHGSPFSPDVGHNGHKLSYSYKWLTNFKEKYLLAHHLHFEAVELMKYMTLLSRVADLEGTKLYFINNACPWTQGYFDRKLNFMPNELDLYTQQLLDIDSRNDSEIFELYDLMHNDFEGAGGINNLRWINLYQSFISMMVDVGTDMKHPGPLSHNKFGKFLAHKFSLLDIR